MNILNNNLQNLSSIQPYKFPTINYVQVQYYTTGKNSYNYNKKLQGGMVSLRT